MNINEKITKIIEKAERNGITSFGIRQHHKVVKIGNELGVSYNTVDGENEEELKGICCLQTSYDGFEVEDFDYDIESIKKGNYQDGSIVLVGGTGSEYGNDDSELIIENPVVLWVL